MLCHNEGGTAPVAAGQLRLLERQSTRRPAGAVGGDGTAVEPSSNRPVGGEQSPSGPAPRAVSAEYERSVWCGTPHGHFGQTAPAAATRHQRPPDGTRPVSAVWRTQKPRHAAHVPCGGRRMAPPVKSICCPDNPKCQGAPPYPTLGVPYGGLVTHGTRPRPVWPPPVSYGGRQCRMAKKAVWRTTLGGSAELSL